MKAKAAYVTLLLAVGVWLAADTSYACPYTPDPLTCSAIREDCLNSASYNYDNCRFNCWGDDSCERECDLDWQGNQLACEAGYDFCMTPC